MIVIQWIRRPGEGETYRFDRSPVSIGLSPRNDLVLEGRGLLRKHLTVERLADGSFLLTSMSSRDAAVVNGEKVLRGAVRAGDRVQVGSVHLLFLGDGRPVTETPPAFESKAAPPRKRSTGPVNPKPDADEGASRSSLTILPAEPDGAVTPPAVAERPARAAAAPRRRGRRPVELAEIAAGGPAGQLRRQLHEQLRRRATPLEMIGPVFSLLRERFRNVSFLLFARDEEGVPRLFAASETARGFVFSRKALAAMEENPHPMATREGDRTTAYFPLVGNRGVVRGWLAARGTVGETERQILEETAFLLALRLPSFQVDASTAKGEPRPLAGGPPVFDEETGALTEEIDDLKILAEGVERKVIDRVLRRVRGNQSKAAEILNISRGSLIAKIRQYSIPDHRSIRRRPDGSAE